MIILRLSLERLELMNLMVDFTFMTLVLTQTDDGTNSDTDVSIGFGVEYQAASWLQWRMSVRQALLQSGILGFQQAPQLLVQVLL